MGRKKEIEQTGSAVGIAGVRARIGGLKEIVRQGAQAVLRYRVMLVRIVLPAVYCLLFGGTGFEMGIYPFGISAVCAAMSGVPAAAAAAGNVVSSLFVRGGYYIAAASVAGSAALVLVKRFRGDTADSVTLRGALSMTLGAAQSVAFALPDGIGFYELCGVLLSAALCPVLTVGLRGLFMSSGKSESSLEAGMYVIVYTCAYFLRALSPAGVSVATVVSMAGVLMASYSFGIHRGVMAGVALGLAADPQYSLMYAAAAAGAGVLMGISPMAAVAAGVLLAFAFAVASGGASAFGDLFPELMFAAAVAGPLLHYGVIPVWGQVSAESVRSEAGERTLRDRLRAMAGSLSAISSAMGRLSGVLRRPSAAELRQMCDEAFDVSCAECDGRGLCWDREYRSTAAALGAMASLLRKGGAVDAGYFPEGMRQRCRHSVEILSRINAGAAMASRSAAKTDSTGVIADDYGAMSRLLSDMSEAEDAPGLDPAASRTLGERLGALGLRSALTEVYGKRRRRVVIRGLEHGCSVSGEELQAAAESVLGCRMNAPEYRVEGRSVTAAMHTAERFAVRIGRCSIAKRGERCGDSITSFKGDGGYFYTLISDGMGSGGEAAMTSGISAMFLERMLSAGCTLSTALEMLNSFLVRRRSECFTTVDLMEADLVTGELSFVKSGAAPSFILRDGRLFRLASKTVPVGIVTPCDAEKLRFTAKEGDFAVMLSDGAVPDGEEAVWLYEMLCGDGMECVLFHGCDVNAAAEQIAKRAAEECRRGDDVTVGVVELYSANLNK